jgi:hypothetical protein
VPSNSCKKLILKDECRKAVSFLPFIVFPAFRL